MISTEPAPSQARTVRRRGEVHEFMVQQARKSNMGRQDMVPRQGPLVSADGRYVKKWKTFVNWNCSDCS